jgi:hypothetical protein
LNSTHGREDLPDQALAILRTHCASCHGPESTGKGGFDYLLDRDRLVARGQLVPGQAEASTLFRRIQEGEMPPGKRARLSAVDLSLLRRWIEAGAPAREEDAPTSLVTESRMIQAILADVQSLDPRQRRFARYLTLAHLGNEHALQDVLQVHRKAVAKLVNSLSWHPRIAVPHPIDAAQTIYRIDLRDYRWTVRSWERLVTQYPYRLSETGATVKSLQEATGSLQPYLRGDWFLAVASRPPFYHEFLQLPATDRALERLLQVDVLGDIHDDNVVRAGFNGSGVARNNRIIERHDAAHGAYWRSYDFSDNAGRQNIFERPLGPAPGPGGFTAAGGEIIFHLPNGLQGYFLVDAEGRRLDKAPGEIVSDPARPDRRVENGLSCFSCHVRGLIPKDDQLRAHALGNRVAFSPDDRAAVLALYPQPARMRNLMKADTERFARALQAVGVSCEAPEPILTAALRYERVLDLRRAAAELGRTPADLAARLRHSPEQMRTLGALLVKGGTVQRNVFEEMYPRLPRDSLGEDTRATGGGESTDIPFHAHHEGTRGLAFAPTGLRAASVGADRTIRLWELTTGQQLRHFDGYTDEVNCIAFAPDNRSMIIGGRDRTIRLGHLESGKEVRRFVGHTDAVHTVAISADGRFVASGGADRTVRIWEIQTGKEWRCLAGHAATITCVAFTPDGRYVLSGSHDRTVRLWEAASGRERGRWLGHTAAIYCVAISPDGRLAASGGADHALHVWDIAEGKLLRRCGGHVNPIVRVAFTPDGRFILAGSSQYRTADAIVRVWDVANGREKLRIEGSGLSHVECVTFSPDGRQVLLSDGGELRLLPLAR